MIAIVKNLEIRGKEKKTSRNGNEYLIVRADDERGIGYELYEPNVSNFKYYKRGQVANFYLDIEPDKYNKNWKVIVDSFEYCKEDEDEDEDEIEDEEKTDVED